MNALLLLQVSFKEEKLNFEENTKVSNLIALIGILGLNGPCCVKQKLFSIDIN